MLLALIIVAWLIAALAIGAALLARPPAPPTAAEAPPRELELELDLDLAQRAPAIIRAPSRARRPGVVLVHGVLGFDQLGVGKVRVDYFRGIAAKLEQAGLEVITTRTSPLGSIPTRGAQLARALDELPNDRLVLIGHSMGGLDARWALAREGVAPRVAALLTVGTPHRGTPICDLLAMRPLHLARRTIAKLGLSSDAVDWMTTHRLAALNAELGDVVGVRYASILAATHDRGRVHPLLRASHAYLARTHGPSDGLVPRSSQIWGEIVGEEELDHWAQQGWSTQHDAAAMLLRALTRLDALLPRATTQPLLPAAAIG